MKLFLDANVLLDWFLEREHGYQAALALLGHARQGRVEVSTTSLNIVTAHYVSCERSNLTEEEWESKLLILESFLGIVPVHKHDLYHALSLHWHDYEDAVQYCAARQAACDLFVTRNTKDFTLSDIPVRTSEEALDIILA